MFDVQSKTNRLTDDESVSSSSRWQDVLEDLRHVVVRPAVIMPPPKLDSSATLLRESERISVTRQDYRIFTYVLFLFFYTTD